MKLSRGAIQSLRKRRTTYLLAAALDKCDATIIHWLRENAENGPLTRVGIVSVVAKLLGKEVSEVIAETETESTKKVLSTFDEKVA